MSTVPRPDLPGVPADEAPRRTAPWWSASRDAIAGLVVSVVLIANIVSFAALMFPGDMAAGTATAVWAMLVGACVGGIWIALDTSLPPLATGIDSPTGAVLVLLSASTGGAVLRAGGSPQAAVQTVMLVFSAATVLTGALLYGLGARRLGSWFRFVPYFVVAGFLGATGWLLAAGGLRVTTGHELTLAGLAAPWHTQEIVRLGCALAVLAVLLGLRRWVKSPLALPAAIVVMWLAGAAALHALGLNGPGWYLPSLGTLASWSPLRAARDAPISWAMAAQLLPELCAVALVALVSVVAKVSALEVSRKTSGDLDRELRAHGIASLLCAPFGGLTSSLQTGTSRLLEHAGGVTRWSGVAGALCMGIVAVTQVDLPGVVPVPIVAGLVFYLGWIFIVDAFGRPFAQRAWFNLLLGLAITAVCVRWGYLVGVLGGVIGACVLFVASYARIGAVRQHLTRTHFASYASRSPQAARHLAEHGEAIQIYRLSGYVFFGSSEAVFERVRDDMRALPAGRVHYVVVDFGLVSGVDSSATSSLAKLRNLCRKQNAVLACCGMSPTIQRALDRDGLLDPKTAPAFDDLNAALAWCEERLLARAGLDHPTSVETFEPWLREQLGNTVSTADFAAYLERRDVADGHVLYRQGDPSDGIDLLASGTLAVDIATAGGALLRVRSIDTHTVVGEMGFFRQSPRSATVSSQGPATVYTLSRDNFVRMRREHPELANAFEDFILRVLADRITVSERAVAALSR
jgi:SulP family sulfate permease